MDSHIHSHSLTMLRRIGYLCLGLFFAIFGLGFATVSLFSEDPAYSFLPVLILFTCLLSVGVLFITTSLLTKVVTSVERIEYHTPLLIVSAGWHNLEVYERHKSGKYSLVLIPTEGTVVLRPLIKMVPWLVRKDARSFNIDTSHFSSSDGHLLETEINAFHVSQAEN